MFQAVRVAVFTGLLLTVAESASAQSGYQVVSVSSPGAITATGKWTGLTPRFPVLPITKNPDVYDHVHMDGAAAFNLPFPFANRVVSRTMHSEGLVNLKCNEGHVWMNAEILVAPHPYYAVTDEDGRFKLTGVPPGQYQIGAWHEGCAIAREEEVFDVLTEQRVQRPIFTEPKTWEKKVIVGENDTVVVTFIPSDK
jgi:hypothetical protein